MKYKLISIICIIICITTGIIFSSYDFKKTTNEVYHEHLERENNRIKCQGQKKCSHLSIINIKTNNKLVPTKEDEIKYLKTTMEVYDNDDINILGKNSQKYNIELRYRGRSSLKFDKKGYAIKFVDKHGKNKNESLLGMPKANKWVLHGPFIDKSLMRNYMWYNIGNEIMGSAPKTRFFELYVDGVYNGLYLAVESVTREEKTRIQIAKHKKNSPATSYLLLVDTENGTQTTRLNNFSKYTYKLGEKINITIKYPDEDEITPALKKYIEDDFNKFDSTLYELGQFMREHSTYTLYKRVCDIISNSRKLVIVGSPLPHGLVYLKMELVNYGVEVNTSINLSDQIEWIKSVDENDTILIVDINMDNNAITKINQVLLELPSNEL